MALSQPEPLAATHDVAGFSCGKPALDHWLKTRALTNQQKGFTAVIPAVLPRSIRTGQPPEPVPCLLLGQLATDLAWKGKGIGTGLLGHALERCVAAASLIGGRALVVNAVDQDAAAFWRRRGFIASKDDPLLLFRSVADIAASIEAAMPVR